MVTRDSLRMAGWYDDQADAALLRYWDGAKWSPHTAPKPTDAPRPGRVELIDDTIDEATTMRHGVPDEHTARLRPPEEHTTVPLPPGTVADDGRPLEANGERRRVAWILIGTLMTLGLISIAVSGIVALTVR